MQQMNMLITMLNAIQSPQSVMNNLMQQNKDFQRMVQEIKQSGLSPQQYLQRYAQMNNIDLNAFSGFLNKR